MEVVPLYGEVDERSAEYTPLYVAESNSVIITGRTWTSSDGGCRMLNVRTSKSSIIVSFFIGAFLAIGFFIFYPVYIDICEGGYYGTPQKCEPHNVLYITFLKVMRTITHAEFWTALATIAIAAFTWTLKKSTDKLWDASREQLQHSELATHQELRAYIGHMCCPYDSWQITGADGHPITVYGRAKYFDMNYGRTPATDVSMFIRVVNGGAPTQLDNELLPEERQHVVQIVHPNQNVGRIIETAIPTAIRDTFFFYGYVDYTDIFGGRWRHRFAFSHDPRRLETGGERYVAHDSYNNEEYLGRA
jgi:hypothetical protein